MMKTNEINNNLVEVKTPKMDFSQGQNDKGRITFDAPEAIISFDNRGSGVVDTESNKHIDIMR